MAAFSSYLGNNILDHILDATAYTSPTNVYGALFVGDPQGAGTEVSAGGYAREVLSFAVASGLSSSSDTTVTFGPATASWGTVDYFAIYDASSGGNLLVSGALSASKTVETDDSLEFASGNITVSIT